MRLKRLKTQEKNIQALSLAKECYGMKLELLTNATVVDDAMRFASAHGIPEKKLEEAEIEVISKIECTNEHSNISYNTTF